MKGKYENQYAQKALLRKIEFSAKAIANEKNWVISHVTKTSHRVDPKFYMQTWGNCELKTPRQIAEIILTAIDDLNKTINADDEAFLHAS